MVLDTVLATWVPDRPFTIAPIPSAKASSDRDRISQPGAPSEWSYCDLQSALSESERVRREASDSAATRHRAHEGIGAAQPSKNPLALSTCIKRSSIN